MTYLLAKLGLCGPIRRVSDDEAGSALKSNVYAA